MKSIGMIELNSIARGILVTDHIGNTLYVPENILLYSAEM